ncbi:glycosyltransferase [Luteibacter aegosomatissinici]|uniref:glycosyltransferase n=1 Tax=Luteibacter aegosomatissinici TaxID=2911539 RepID=UPI001FF9030F|nr:glycosyltransferase family 2 protein [Luteibacter aegosomatissinici]UPG95681.1 glycosyltransferase family 2 protein [Luteibacter aegosomatissinici]
MSTPVAAITLEFRSPSRTVRCVRAMLAEGVARVLVVDNSEDGGESAARLREAFVGDARVLVHVNPTNLGFARGVNGGLALLREEAWRGRVLLINNDATLVPGALASLGRTLDLEPRAALAYPEICHAGKSLTLVYYQRATGLLSPSPLAGSFPYVSGCCMLLSSQTAASDVFDETFFMYGEDVEFSYRLARHGRPVAFAAGAQVDHVGAGASGLGSVFYETHMVAAHVILARRLARRGFERGIFLSGRVVFLTLRASLRSLRYRSWVPWRALSDGWALGQRALTAVDSNQSRDHPPAN